MSKIPFIDLKRQFRALEPSIRARIDRVLEHGQFVLGPEIHELEAALARFAGVRHAITCSSGTDALLMPLMAWGIGRGDAVVTTPFTFIATAEVIALVGATPVFVDIDPRTFNLDPERLEETIEVVKREGELRPRAIIAVDLFGLPADYDALQDIAARHGLFLLEDAAQSFGATYRDRPAGGFGHAAATSFFPAKPLGCYGDGGAVLTGDEQLAETLRSIRVHGKGSDKYDNVRVGLNARMDTLQAAIVLAKLEVFPAELKARQSVAQGYTEMLVGSVEVPYVPEECMSAWAQYSILVDDRARVQQGLAHRGVPTAIYYPKPLHLQTAFEYLGYRIGDFPRSEAVSERIVSLPFHPYLEETDISRIVDGLCEAL